MNRTLDSVQYFSGNEIASFWEFLVKANIFLTVWYEAFPPIKGRRKGSRESSYQVTPVFTALRDYPISPSLLPTLRQHDVKTAMSNFTESQPKTKKQQQRKENNGAVSLCENLWGVSKHRRSTAWTAGRKKKKKKVENRKKQMKKNLSVAKGGRSWRKLFKNPWVEIMNSWPQIYISFTTRETEKPPTKTQNTIITFSKWHYTNCNRYNRSCQTKNIEINT